MEFYNIAQKIKNLRKEANLTQEELAKKAGISRQTLAKLEKGNIDKISLLTFIKILEQLNYEIDIKEKEPFYYFDAKSIL